MVIRLPGFQSIFQSMEVIACLVPTSSCSSKSHAVAVQHGHEGVLAACLGLHWSQGRASQSYARKSKSKKCQVILLTCSGNQHSEDIGNEV